MPPSPGEGTPSSLLCCHCKHPEKGCSAPLGSGYDAWLNRFSHRPRQESHAQCPAFRSRRHPDRLHLLALQQLLLEEDGRVFTQDEFEAHVSGQANANSWCRARGPSCVLSINGKMPLGLGFKSCWGADTPTSWPAPWRTIWRESCGRYWPKAASTTHIRTLERTALPPALRRH